VRGVGGGGERRSRPAPVKGKEKKVGGFSKRVGAQARPGGPGESERGTRKSTDFPGQLPQSTRLDGMAGRHWTNGYGATVSLKLRMEFGELSGPRVSPLRFTRSPPGKKKTCVPFGVQQMKILGILQGIMSV
jgi:hypothetical protein